MRQLVPNLRFAFRAMGARPLFSIVVVATLALGIGANAAMFTVVDDVLLEPLPYPDADELVWVWGITSDGDRNTISAESYQDYRAANGSFRDLAATSVFPEEYVLTGGDAPQAALGTMVSWNLFRTLGTPPLLGRGFAPDDEDEGSPDVVVLSHRLWHSRYGAAPDVVGRTIVLDGTPRTIVGVMPPEADLFGRTDLWEPLRMSAGLATGRGNNNFRLFGRLRDGVTLTQANAEMKALAAGVAERFPDLFEGWTVDLVPLHEVVIGQVRSTLWLLMGAVGLVLLVTAANLAALMLARSTDRRREVAVRLAMGASRARVVEQLLTESVVMALAGGLLGLGLARTLLAGLTTVGAGSLPRLDAIGLDTSTLVFTAVVSLGTGILFGLAPAVQVPRLPLVETLKEAGGRGSGRTTHRTDLARGALVIAQVALSVVLLAGAGLLLRSFQQLRSVELGIDPAGVLTAQVRLPAAEYGPERPPSVFWEAALERVRALPGVESATVAGGLPVIGGTGPWNYAWAEGHEPATPADRQGATRRLAAPGYFETFDIPLEGRGFTTADREDGLPVVIISRSAAETFFPGENPIGQGLIVWGTRFEIVGVAGDVMVGGPDGEYAPIFYLSLHQMPFATSGTLVLRTAIEPEALASELRTTLRAVDPNAPIEEIATMASLVEGTLATDRLRTLVLGAFAVTALLLAALGLYGVLATFVGQRTHEMGVRMALGAEQRQVMATVLTRGLALAGTGLALGVVLALAAARLLQGMLFGVGALDLRAFGWTIAILAVTAVAAALAPALAATRVDPVESLRAE